MSSNNFLIDALKYLPIKILPALSGLLSVFILTSSFSQNTYINYSFIISSILLTSQLFGGWINSVMLYFIPKCKDEGEELLIINQIIYIQMFLLSIGVITLYGVLFFIGGKSINIEIIALFIFLIQIFNNFFSSYLQSKRKIKAQILSTSLQAFFQIISLLVIKYYYPNNLQLYLLLYCISFLLSLISLLINSKIKINFKHIDSKKNVEILKYGIPICVWFFSTQFYSIGDRIILKYYNVTDNVVNYIAFKDLAIGLSGFISMPLLFASHPIIMNLVFKENNKIEAANLIEKNINILLLIFLPCILIVFFYGEFIFKMFLSSKYLLSPINMLLLLLTVLISCISIYLQKGLEVSFKTIDMFKISLLVAVLSLVLNLSFIPKFSVMASIFIGLLCQILYSVIIYKKSSNELPMDYKNLYIPFFIIIILISLLLNEFRYEKIFNYLIYPLLVLGSIVYAIIKLKITNLLRLKKII